jgi:hypothetical protein
MFLEIQGAGGIQIHYLAALNKRANAGGTDRVLKCHESHESSRKNRQLMIM